MNTQMVDLPKLEMNVVERRGVRVLRRSAARSIRQEEASGAVVLDVTSKGAQPWVQFSPFYPHYDIPVPLSPGHTTASVEGAWQALKVFEHADIDLRKLQVAAMKGLKRSSRSHGRVLGHRAGIGIGSEGLLPYVQARHQIYLPLYHWVLEHNLGELVERVRALASERSVVLLDYETNPDVDDPSHPLSHAALIKAFVEGNWPV